MDMATGWVKMDVNGTFALVRQFTFDDFAAALSFANLVGAVAERLGHHPDILIGWGKTRITTTTHDAGGLTAKDYELAEAINSLG